MNQELYFCTVSDSKFVLETTALFNSLKRETQKINQTVSLTVLCLDDLSYTLYPKINNQIKVVSLKDLNDPELMQTKSSRKHGEFAQTSKASLVCYLLKKMPPNAVLSFVDSDIYYYGNPGAMLEQDKDWSVLITTHWFTEAKKLLSTKVGTYNSGFVCFKNDDTGKKYAKLWRENCIEWCFNRFEKDKFTDQFYLEHWPKNKLVKVSSHKGINMGTWNLHRFKISIKKKVDDDIIFVDEMPLISYHFHGLKLYLNNGKIKAYPVTVHHKIIYQKFIDELQKTYNTIHAIDPSLSFRFSPHPGILRIIKQIFFRLFETITKKITSSLKQQKTS